MKNVKKIISTALHNPETRLFVVVNSTLAVLTVASVLALILETVVSFQKYHQAFKIIEYIAVSFFTLEYAARIFISKKKKHYIFGFFGIVDLVAILPFLLVLANLTFLKAVRVLHVVRFLRAVRLIKLMHLRQQGGEGSMARKIMHKIDMQIYFFALFSSVVIFGTLLFIFEGDQSAAANIPLAMLWVSKAILGGVAQSAPITIWGDLIIIVTRFTGLLLFGLLIYLVGGAVNKFLFGTEEPGGPHSLPVIRKG